ncbi:MAG: hypothetical protein RLY57_391 [Candidatus Parcubacteria bacterium]|jgi:hypothetical protein
MNQSDKKDNQIDNSILQHGVLNKDLYNAYVINKVQKLSKAFYLVTNFFDVREPLKWSIRDLSLKLVQHAMSLSLASLSHREKSLMEFVSIAQELDILMDTAQVAGFISSMNAEVIKRELKGLVVFVEDKHDMHYSTSSRLMLTPSYFKVDEVKSFVSHVPAISQQERSVARSGFELTKDIAQKAKGSLKDVVKVVPQQEGLERRKKVLDIGRTLELFSIKDISTQVTDCSEKTIQRLLIDMVNEGVLVKEGERRWSRYKIAK